VNISIRPLVPDEAEATGALRREMLADAPFAFLASPQDDFASDAAAVRKSLAGGPDQVTFGAFGPARVGSVGMSRERHVKASHKVCLWGMYVTPAMRKHRIGRRRVEAAVAHARTLSGVSQVILSVSDTASGARKLYESVGFRVWGTEPRAMCVGGRMADEHHVKLMLV
jgi:GNAT superfamily N-acetyltransferase